jgi:RNA polymerase sigma-70 factor, ECF subfamily
VSDGKGTARLWVLPNGRVDQLDDVALHRAALDRRPEAVDALWRRFAPMVRGLLRRGIGRNDVEDIVQEVFLQFFTKLHTIRDPQAMRMFALRIAINALRGEIRARRVRRWLRLTDDGATLDAEAIPEDFDAREALTRFYALLDHFSASDRAACVLRNIEGMELEEVAQALGVSLATIKRRLARIERRIQAIAAGDDVLSEWLVFQPRSVPSAS